MYRWFTHCKPGFWQALTYTLLKLGVLATKNWWLENKGNGPACLVAKTELLVVGRFCKDMSWNNVDHLVFYVHMFIHLDLLKMTGKGKTYSPKWWFFMLIYHGRIRIKKNNTPYKAVQVHKVQKKMCQVVILVAFLSRESKVPPPKLPPQ